MIPVLDHGYVSYVEHWGSDERIIEAARMSVQKGFKGWGNAEHPGDEKLLSFLWREGHSSPFEMAGLIVEVQAPILVARQWYTHRTQSRNEASARYAPLPGVDYLPTVERLMFKDTTGNKQAQSKGKELTLEDAAKWRSDLEDFYRLAEDLYSQGLEVGVPKELARVCMTVGRYTKFRASVNLWNWLGFLKRREHGSAQWEIREYSRAVHHILATRFPRTLELYENHS